MWWWILGSVVGAAVAAVLVWALRLHSLAAFRRLLAAFANRGRFFQVALGVDEETSRHGGDAVAEVLKAHGVEVIFTLCGGHISPILVASERRGIRIVDTRHEVSAVFAADALARLKQSIGVAAVTAGPGLTNTITAVKNAQMAESPILLIGGAAATLLKGRGALQDIDQMALFKPLCKFTATITRVADIAPVLRQAIHSAQSDTPGPVFVEFPIDTLYPYSVIHKELGVNPNAKGLGGAAVNAYLEWHISRLFGEAWERREIEPIPAVIAEPSEADVAATAALLRSAQRPLLLVGSQATLPPVSPQNLRSAVEKIGIPAFLGGMARGLLGRSGPLQIRQQRREALKEADVVILAGTVADFRLGYGRTLSSRSKIVSINRSREQLLKNSDMFWKPKIAAQADVGSFLWALSEELGKDWKGAPEAWTASLRVRDAAKEAKNAEMAKDVPQAHLNPIKVLQELEKHLPEDAILVADGGDFVGTAAYTVRPRGPLQWLDPGAFGTLGVGGGFAIGAAIACPNRPIWILYGDGSLGYSLAEFDTYKRHGLAVTAVVGNDACWSQIAREQVPMLGSSIGCELAFSDYDQAVMGLGGQGYKLDSHNEAALPDIVKRAAQLNAEKTSVLLNVLIGKSSFREGSISV